MANITYNKYFSVTIFLFLVVLNQFQLTEGIRNLPNGGKDDGAVRELSSSEQGRPTGLRVLIQGEVDSFRPTNPGRSPGIGHSTHD